MSFWRKLLDAVLGGAVQGARQAVTDEAIEMPKQKILALIEPHVTDAKLNEIEEALDAILAEQYQRLTGARK